MPRLTPTEEQAAAIHKMATEPTGAALNASELGTGKTVMSVELCRVLGAQTILLIGPINTRGGWRHTFEQQEIDLPFREINSTKAGIAAQGDLERGVPGIYFVGREFFHLSATEVEPKFNEEKKTWTKGRKRRWTWDKTHPDIAIYDEVQAVNNRWSNGFKVLEHLKPKYRLALSATPQGNAFKGIWSVCRWLWPKAVDPKTDWLYVDTSQWRWAAEWAVVVDDFWSGKRITGEKNPGAFVNSLPCYVRLLSSLAAPNEETIIVELSKAQRKMYDEMEAQAFTWLDEHPLAAEFPIVKRSRLRQMTLGTLTIDENDEVIYPEDTDSAKLDALQEYIAKHPDDNLLVLTHSKRFARVAARRLGDRAAAWTGDVSAKQRDEIKARFGKDLQFIVAVTEAVAEGLDGLQLVCNTVVILSESDSDMMNVQAIGRVNRTGQTKPVLVLRIQALHTDDDGTFERLMDTRLANRRSLTV